MYKKSGILLTGVLLVGCQQMDSQQEWVTEDGCEKYFSETPRDLASCRAYVEAQKTGPKTEMAEGTAPAVTTSPVGPYVGRFQDIKEFEPSEDSLTED